MPEPKELDRLLWTTLQSSYAYLLEVCRTYGATEEEKKYLEGKIQQVKKVFE